MQEKVGRREAIISRVEAKHEVEAKCLLQREQTISFLEGLNDGKKTSYDIDQRWIKEGENEGVRLRKKTFADGKVKRYLTHKVKEKINGKDVTFEREEELTLDMEGFSEEKKKEMLSYISFFEENWDKIESTSVKKKRHEILVKFRNKKQEKKEIIKVEIDLFDDSELTVAEIEFPGENVEQAMLKMDKFDYKKFFGKIGLSFELIDYGDKDFKNRRISSNKCFLDGGFKKTKYYLELLKKLEKRNKKK